MQSTHMASQQITEEAVYLCTGNPLPKDIEQIAHWLLNESFTTSYKSMLNIEIHTTVLLLFVHLFLAMNHFQEYLKSRLEKGWPWLIS